MKKVIENTTIEELNENENEFQLYDFMNDPRFSEMEIAVEYVDFFMTVKQDTLVKLDALNCSIINAKLNIAKSEADELLNVNFKEMYGKDNESIRKSHLQKINEELYEQLEGYKYQKSVYMNMLNILDDMIKSNQILLSEHTCNCSEGE